MDGWIYGYTDKRVRYDIRSSGGVTPDDERTRATCSSLSRHLLYLLPTVRDRRLRQVQQTGIVVRRFAVDVLRDCWSFVRRRRRRHQRRRPSERHEEESDDARRRG